MPMPIPEQAETRDEFLRRCLGDSTMRRDFPPLDQRTAVCIRQWNEKQTTVASLCPDRYQRHVGLVMPARVQALERAWRD